MLKRLFAGRPGLTLLLSLSVAFCGAGRAPAQTPAQAKTPVTSNATDTEGAKSPQKTRSDNRLYAQLWTSSPEYKALCLMVFNQALEAVREQVEHAPETGATPLGARAKPMAVVADLDETILDNSGFEKLQILEGKTFNEEAWRAFVAEKSGVKLVPGARRFIQEVQKLGVRMVYVSNRPDSLRQETIETLKALGVDTSGLEDRENSTLLLRTDRSDKEPRRVEVAQKYDIAAFLGDNLGDFPSLIGADNRERGRKAEFYQELWGTRWFVLPNPVYGDWTDSFRNRDPFDYLDELAHQGPKPGLLDPSLAHETAPEEFKVRFETTKGTFVVQVHRSWAPLGADRFYNLVKVGFYDDATFFRVVPGFVVQFGIHADPAVSAKWSGAKIDDDPVTQSNVRGTICFATAGPNTRTTQLFVNYGDNSRLDKNGFAPFGEVVAGMDVVDSIFAGHGQRPNQAQIEAQGNAYLRNAFPELDYILQAEIN